MMLVDRLLVPSERARLPVSLCFQVFLAIFGCSATFNVQTWELSNFLGPLVYRESKPKQWAKRGWNDKGEHSWVIILWGFVTFTLRKWSVINNLFFLDLASCSGDSRLWKTTSWKTNLTSGKKYIISSVFVCDWLSLMNKFRKKIQKQTFDIK